MNQNLIRRILTAVVGLAVLLPLLIWSFWGVWLLCLLASVLGLWEFYQVSGLVQPRYRFPIMGVAVGMWGVILIEKLGSIQLPDSPSLYLWGLLLLFPILALSALYNEKEKTPLQTLSMGFLGLVYCFLPWVLYFQLSAPNSENSYNFWVPIGILALVWVLDVMAYFCGRFFGKRPLFPRISPKKTWEGSLGGAAFCLLTGFLLDTFLPEQAYSWLLIAILISIFSQLGDLVESMFKRSIDIKDSGTILPGHGGILDRFDGFFFAMPIVYLYFSSF